MSETIPTIARPESAVTPDTPISEAETAVEDIAAAVNNPTLAGGEKAVEDVSTVLSNPKFATAVSQIPNIIRETKPGYKTTEFWASIGAVLADLGLEVETKEKLLLSGIVAVYSLARGLAKNGTPNVTPVLPEVNDGP